MYSRSHDSHNNKSPRQGSRASSHLLGLQCVIDKYQHENQMLCQKVSFLIEENKRLKLGSMSNMLSTNKDRLDDDLGEKISRRDLRLHQSNRYQHHVPSLDLRSTNLKLGQQTYNPRLSQHTQSSGRNKYLDHDSPRLYHPRKTQRKQQRFNYLSKSKQIIDNRIARTIGNQPLHYSHSGINARMSSVFNSGNDQQTQRFSYKTRQKTKTEPSSNIFAPGVTSNYSNTSTYMKVNIIPPLQPILLSPKSSQSILPSSLQKAQNKPQYKSQAHIQAQNRAQTQSNKTKISRKQQINKNVYLEGETVFLDEQSYQKLPTFVQASFGNMDSKVSSQDSNIKTKQTSRILELTKKNQNNNVNTSNNSNRRSGITTPVFKLDKSSQQKTDYFCQANIAKSHLIQIAKIEQKQNLYGHCRKTNSPYTKSDYKLSQPKTQLTKIMHPQRKIEQPKVLAVQEISQNMVSLQKKECQRKIVIKSQNEQISKYEVQNKRCQRVTERHKIFLEQTTKTTNFGKKTFLNVVSRKPKPSLFLK